MANIRVTHDRLTNIREQAQKGLVMVELAKTLLSGWPEEI